MGQVETVARHGWRRERYADMQTGTLKWNLCWPQKIMKAVDWSLIIRSIHSGAYHFFIFFTLKRNEKKEQILWQTFRIIMNIFALECRLVDLFIQHKMQRMKWRPLPRESKFPFGARPSRHSNIVNLIKRLQLSEIDFLFTFEKEKIFPDDIKVGRRW